MLMHMLVEKAESEQRDPRLLQQKIGSNLGGFLNKLFLVMNNQGLVSLFKCFKGHLDGGV